MEYPNDIDQLRYAWQQMNQRIEKLETEKRRLVHRIVAGRATSARQKLASSIRIAIFAGMMLPLLATLLTDVLGFDLWIAVYYAVYGVAMAIIDIALYRSIVSVDYMSLPTVKALEGTLNMRRHLRQARFVGIVTVLPLLFLMFYDSDDKAILTGMAIGLAIGLVIGIIKWRQQSKLLRNILDELHEIENEPDIDISAPITPE